MTSAASGFGERRRSMAKRKNPVRPKASGARSFTAIKRDYLRMRAQFLKRLDALCASAKRLEDLVKEAGRSSKRR
jgi:hypothetical protein